MAHRRLGTLHNHAYFMQPELFLCKLTVSQLYRFLSRNNYQEDESFDEDSSIVHRIFGEHANQRIIQFERKMM